MPNSDSSGGIYSPLPQTTLTDSESEEELLRRTTTITVRRITAERGGGGTLSGGGGGSSGARGGIPTAIMMNGMKGRPVAEVRATVGSAGGTENGGAALYNGGYPPSPSDVEDASGVFHADNVAILHEAGSIPDRKMSFPRKCCFVASLVVCFLAVVVFLWIIPCSDELSCPARAERVKTQNWIRNYEKIELKGVINVVEGVHGKSKNLVFMYRGDKLFPEFDESYRRRNGIISLVGSSGKVAWYDQMINEPKSIDCTLLDADRSGAPDCLVLDEYGQLECIDPLSGEWLWHAEGYNKRSNSGGSKQNDMLDFPLLIPDVDGDKVYDLLFVTSSSETKHNRLVMISGRKGVTIGDSYAVKECLYVHKLMLDEELNVKFNCVKEKSEQQKAKSLPELYKLIHRKALDMRVVRRMPTDLPQHKFFGQRRNTEKQRTITNVGGKQLVVENRGKCPENCSTSVLLTEESTGELLWNVSGRQLYGMQPVRLSFSNFGSDNRSTMYGFVIKFWEWSQRDPDNRSSRFKRALIRWHDDDASKQRFIHQQPWIGPPGLDAISKTSSSARGQNQTSSSSASSSSSGRPAGVFRTRMRFLKETIKLIVFNSTYIKIENTSQSNVIQFCRETISSDPAAEVLCQPDLNYQENSLLIADLDDDGSQELVSYYSTFVKTATNEADGMGAGVGVGPGATMKLKTYVQLLRLESELPKLYSPPAAGEEAGSEAGKHR
ncbi:AGAP005946-PA [Anopheles gambiae str. PEST]|uniref:AGAP005946-PA n=1 Tax=Anopheles gambiae TaxID=7165 RepID=Q7Q6A8_ANOGA|nr:AGAP005946-PA [Anopheles gambiae str. PEST]